MKLCDVMKSPRLKVKGADRHIDSLTEAAGALPKHLYEITNGPIRSHTLLAGPDKFAATYTPKEPIPEYFAQFVGDAVNNLRESLDVWMNKAVQCVGSSRRVHFPFCEERKHLEVSRNYKPVLKDFPDAAKFISKNIQPCRDTNFDLWAVNRLSNLNKHNDFIPTATLVEMKNVNMVIGTNRFFDLAIYGDASQRRHFVESRSPISMEENYDVVVEVKFPQGGVFEDQPIGPTLKKLSQLVSETLDALEEFIAPHCK